MKNISLCLVFAVLISAVLSCKLTERFVGGDQNLERASALWSDVPQMDGLAPSELELPLAIKVVMRTALNNLWRLNDKNEDKTPVAGDWIVFTTTSSPGDIRSFYTNQRMTSFGNWEAANKENTCLASKDSGIDGVICVFHKIANDEEVLLAVIPVNDGSTKQTSVFFVRLEKKADPEAVNAATKESPVARPANPTGSVPYGVDKRPMPTGLDIDTLLPKRVATYERVKLEKSEQRDVAPTELTIDGNSIYATYRAGSNEVFVEVAVSGSASQAKNILRVVAGDVSSTEPTADDPSFKSINTEPGFVKSIDESGAFFGWTRGGYFFSANAKGGVKDLDDFMSAFPY